MADEFVLAPPDSAATKLEAEQAATAVRSKPSSSKNIAAGKAVTVSQKPAKPKARGFSDVEKLEKIKRVEAAVAGGAKLKDAINAESISDQTDYKWKKAVAVPLAEGLRSAASADAELAEFAQLEEENHRLRKLLAEKLRVENVELGKRLGMS